MSDQSFEQVLGDKLRASEAALDMEAESRLEVIRLQAQQSTAGPMTPAAHHRRGGMWLAAATVAAIAVLLTVVVPQQQEEIFEDLAISEYEQVDVELLENLEFYAWLAAEGDMG